MRIVLFLAFILYSITSWCQSIRLDSNCNFDNDNKMSELLYNFFDEATIREWFKNNVRFGFTCKTDAEGKILEIVSVRPAGMTSKSDVTKFNLSEIQIREFESFLKNSNVFFPYCFYDPCWTSPNTDETIQKHKEYINERIQKDGPITRLLSCFLEYYIYVHKKEVVLKNGVVDLYDYFPVYLNTINSNNK